MGAIFGGKEIIAKPEEVLNPEAETELGETASRQSTAINWSIHPLLLDDATQGPNSWSPYASALLPTQSESQGLLVRDNFVAKKRVKNVDNKHDKRRRQNRTR